MQNNDLKQFNNACNDFLSGKYILANIKLKAILQSINENEKLTDIVSDCIDSFNFDDKFRESIISGRIILPATDKDIIAYCFNILYNLDIGTVGLMDFINKYFTSDELSGGEEFKLFTNTIIKPFNEAINRLYTQTYLLSDSIDYQSNIYHKLMNISKVNIDNIEKFKLKEIESEELTLLLTALSDACEKSNKKLVYALMVGIEYFVKINKKAKEVYLQLKDCFARN